MFRASKHKPERIPSPRPHHKTFRDSSSKTLGKRQQNLLKSFFQRMRGLVAMNYRSTCNFQEEWQKESDFAKNDDVLGDYMLKQTDTLYMLYIIITLIVHIGILWFMSVKEIYGIGGETSTQEPVVTVIAITWLVIEVLDIVVELNTTKMMGDRQILSRKGTFTMYLEENMVSDFLNIIIAYSLLVFAVGSVPSILLTVISIWTLFRKIIQKREAFKTYSNDVELLGQFNLVQLLIFAVLMGHIFVSRFLHRVSFCTVPPSSAATPTTG